MYGKICIKMDMKLLTGMHIGGSSTYSAIGAVDSVVVRDAFTGMPIVPGTSLKGKLRYLLAKAETNQYIAPSVNREPQKLNRLFGTAGNEKANVSAKTARLQFSDAYITNADEITKVCPLTEVKFENTIDRITCTANPRQIERVVRNAIFKIIMVYDIEEEKEMMEDIDTLCRGMKLLSMDYLGGSGSRGYGKVKFSNFEVKALDNAEDVDIVKVENTLKDVESYAVFAD